jgi:archaemetzincin
MPAPLILVPFEQLSFDLLAWLADELTGLLDREVDLGQPLPLPAAGYSKRRRQHLGTALLKALRTSPYPAPGVALGLVDADCYAKGLNFVFGQARPGGPAFVALPRLRPSFYGHPEDQELFRERLLKEALHELGHAWGLFHCSAPGCVMHFSNALADTDRKEHRFCDRCRGELVSLRVAGFR